ncbi:ABC transporter ATP-binding protein [Pelagibius sp. Alg239-R121]|uniref:ABC transporter ATP-binding protein n=1 Tax=Pelagibius sp. Alg239-R121 TaxID=2993448 RepID=UPI0024A76305|nr:ABC transporter ATP-binding protein [Pelagibius sp. Alg239-R121]
MPDADKMLQSRSDTHLNSPEAPGLHTSLERTETVNQTAPRGSIIDLESIELTLPSSAGPVHILRGLSLNIERGETVSVVGPSGSGKSSMMMIMAGLERASSGRVAIGGTDFTALDEDGLARFRRDSVGIVFQDFHLVPTMTALENVAIPLELAGRADAFERSAACLESVGLGHRLSHYPGQLSGGEQQRTALARAFAPEPDLLLADEPTGNLDGATGEAVIELLFDLQKGHGTTLVLITHDPQLAARCSRTVKLLDGLIVDDSPTHGVNGSAGA